MTHQRIDRPFRRSASRSVRGRVIKVLVVDVGGASVKILAPGQQTVRKFHSGAKLTPKQMVAGVVKAAKGWTYDVASIGYPGPVSRGTLLEEPKNLGAGWAGLDFKKAFGCPVKLINDAAMQALGSYEGAGCSFSAWERGWARR